LITGYLIVIITGTLFLLLPIATVQGETTTLLDAFFTAASATAVTGLTVVNTAEHWTRSGQTVIMLLIQIGGLGFMTITTLIFLLLGKRLYLRERLIIMEELNYRKISGVISLTRYILILTFAFELIGTILLYCFFKKMMPVGRAWYFSIFHAISAFNNAGFDLMGNSLEDYVDSVYINLVFSLLFIIGGLGFIVIAEVFSKLHHRSLSLHSRLVISITLILIVMGSVAILILEYNNPATLGLLDLKGKLLASFFQGVTPRTAGFNTITTGHFKDVSLFFLIILMFIGASPGSTGGGVKTTTVGALLIVVYNMALGKKDIEFLRRRFKRKDIYKTLTVVVISLMVIASVTLVLSFTEGFSFIQILFEVFSAFSTVGLSTGITPDLSSIGRIAIIFTMFIGRVGPFTIALALSRKYHERIRYPEEDILIG
jgi:trk system potassium uptake protein